MMCLGRSKSNHMNLYLYIGYICLVVALNAESERASLKATIISDEIFAATPHLNGAYHECQCRNKMCCSVEQLHLYGYTLIYVFMIKRDQTPSLSSSKLLNVHLQEAATLCISSHRSKTSQNLRPGLYNGDLPFGPDTFNVLGCTATRGLY